jgi:hypothetical protein
MSSCSSSSLNLEFERTLTLGPFIITTGLQAYHSTSWNPIIPKTPASLPTHASCITMSSMTTSLETIVLCSGAILATAIVLWCLWKIYGYVGFPIGRMITRLTDPEGENDDKSRSAKFGATVGGFVCYGLIALKTINPVGFPSRSVPGREAYDIAFWIAEFVLQACGEAVAVLAILSGVVKVLGLDTRKQAPASLEKENGRKA